MLFWVHKELENKNVKLLTECEINNLLNDGWSAMILDVWCNRDIEKFTTAEKNKINYLVIYPNDFNNFIDRIKGNNL